jgi:hypothetical protein
MHIAHRGTCSHTQDKYRLHVCRQARAVGTLAYVILRLGRRTIRIRGGVLRGSRAKPGVPILVPGVSHSANAAFPNRGVLLIDSTCYSLDKNAVPALFVR